MSIPPLRSVLWKGACLVLLVGSPALAAENALRVGVYHNPPKLQLGEQGAPSGIFGDLLVAMAEEEGWQLEPVPCRWQACLDELEAGELDLLPDVGWTPARAEILDFHRLPALHSWSQVYQGQGEPLESVLDLEDKRVAVLQGSMQQAYLGQLAENFGVSVTWLPVDDFASGFAAAAEGQADAAVANHLFGDWKAREYGLSDTPILFQPARLFYASAGGRHPQVLARIDDHLERWRQTRASPYYAALQRWGGAEPSPLVPASLWWAMAALAALLVVALVAGALLRRKVVLRTAELQASTEKLATILDSVEAFIYIKSPDLRYQYANRKACELLGVTETEIIGKSDSDLFDPATVAELRFNDQRVIQGGEKVVAEETNVLVHDGSRRTFLSVKLPLRDAGGTIHSLCGISTDITEHRAIQQRNFRLTFYDSLTGLPNRRLLLDRLDKVVNGHRRTDCYGALFCIDLDNFKVVNDLQGLLQGDRLLHRVAERLSSAVRESDTLARLGADEFVLLVHDLGPDVDRAAHIAERLAEKLLAAILDARDVDSQALPVTGSIGITLFASGQASVDGVMQQGDLALQQAKAAGGNALRFFNPAMQAAVMTRVRLEADLHHALARDELKLHYQIQVDVKGRVTGVEALLRWEHPERGMVSPGDFIPLAEQNRMILPIGHWVLETACRQLAEWAHQPEWEALNISVNVSPVQFHQPDFVARVEQVLAATGANPRRLVLEVTESLLMSDPERVRETMLGLHERGIRFALDDFGTGYSSLNYLKRLPLDQLKIDQSFVNDLLDDSVDAAIVKTTITLAESLGLEVTAEGVETSAQHEWLRANGCLAYQGYLFGRPVPLVELALDAYTFSPPS
ncbi:EAL domain-containing protein [Halomonas campisalis]|uniref:EAL domain-containing protein n=1 Tax=Billgrantia campisalis TaxID=74661 RepID=A0ABS9P6E3_9GAMM|nr:EAL domain-containing protein [Halomonas campisalis]MCG6657324.1 EAL domain-containing protein [Halomonas campisalis]MDR5864133.1 EAL domain-containing protein [Halomonas campisalis]